MPQQILFQSNFIGRGLIYRSRYTTTLMTSLDMGSWSDAYAIGFKPSAYRKISRKAIWRQKRALHQLWFGLWKTAAASQTFNIWTFWHVF